MFSLSFPICGMGKRELLIPKELLDRIRMKGVALRPLSKQLMLMVTPTEPLQFLLFSGGHRVQLRQGWTLFLAL